MIPTNLQDDLIMRLEKAFEHDLFNAKGGKRSKLSFFTQNLPKKTDADDEFFPFILIKLIDGEQKNQQSDNMTNIAFVIGVYDNDTEQQGYRDITHIINKIVENVKKNPIVGREFELSYPLKWKLHEEETDPYYFGGVEVPFITSQFRNIETEGLI